MVNLTEEPIALNCGPVIPGSGEALLEFSKMKDVQRGRLWAACNHAHRGKLLAIKGKDDPATLKAIEDAKIAAAKAEAERIAAEKKAEEERIAAEKKAEEERLAAEKLAAEKKAEEERVAAEKKAEDERLVAEALELARASEKAIDQMLHDARNQSLKTLDATNETATETPPTQG